MLYIVSFFTRRPLGRAHALDNVKATTTTVIVREWMAGEVNPARDGFSC